MKRKIISLVLITCFIASMTSCSKISTDKESSSKISQLADTSKYYGTTFGQGDIIDINVTVSEDDWKDIKDNAKDEKYHTADITVNNTTVKNVGFRAKGFSSLSSVANSDSDRYGFKVKLDKYVDNQTLNGLDSFVLNASFSDPSYMREYLTYAASEYLGCQTPFASYCRLSINGELFGFYLCIEAYKDSFVERNTKAEDTVLYKANSENCTLLTSDDGSGFNVNYGEDDDASNIKKLISVLNSTTSENKEELEATLDVDSVLKAIAVNTVMGNYDSYNGSKAHNYYLLYSNGKFSYLGWDYNMSIGGFAEDNGASVTVDVSSPVYNVDISQRPLIGKLLAIDEYNERYLGYVKSLTNYFSDFTGMVSGIADTIREDVKNDPTAFYTIDQFESNIKASDTDLSKVENKHMGGNHGGMKNPYGQTTDMQNKNNAYAGNGNPPAMPDGYGPGGDNGNPPQMPNGNGEGGYGQAPGMPGSNNYMQMPNGGGGMISNNAVSIVDYITQRIAYINKNIK